MNQPDITQQEPHASDDASSGAGMPMPPVPGAEHDSPVSADPPGGTSAAKQVAQLVVIPATIVVVCVGLATLFGQLAGAQDSIDSRLMKLSQSGGAGRMAFGLQDPRYKDRWLAAYDIAVMIPKVHDPSEKLRIGRKLADILENNVGEDEPVLEAYLLMALGQLGSEGGLDPIIARIGSSHARTRQGAISAVLMWPNKAEAQRAIPELSGCLEDSEGSVGAAAAAAIGELGSVGDQATVAALRRAMDRHGTQMQDVRWNAAIALARLGDPQGSRFVAAVLLDREALGEQLAADPIGGGSGTLTEDRIILTTLASAKSMMDQEIWDKIERIAEEDPSRSIRNAARQLVLSRGKPTEVLPQGQGDGDRSKLHGHDG